MRRMPVTRYAALRGVDDNTVLSAIAAGHIRRFEDGFVDPEQADKGWYVQHQATVRARAIRAGNADRFLQAQLVNRAAKVQLARTDLEAIEHAHVDRTDVGSALHDQVSGLLVQLQGARDTEILTCLPAAKSRECVRRFLDELFLELGDLQTAAAEAAAPGRGL